MFDTEIERLRDLRSAALRLRAVARRLARGRTAGDAILLQRTACAAWRVSRRVTGRLRAHPYAPFQADAAVGVILRNSLAARVISFGATTRVIALRRLEKQLLAVLRQVDDTRALAWAADFSDDLGRSQRELRTIASGAEHAIYSACDVIAHRSLATASRPGATSRLATPAGSRSRTDHDWPFLAL